MHDRLNDSQHIAHYITRIENGMPCRLETKRKIILDLGLKISDKNKVFSEDMELSIKD
jgi:hypothetical protein